MGKIKRNIFIVGCGRSGTTMLGAMLGTNSRCITTPESQFNMNIYNSLPYFDALKALDILKNHHRFKIWELDITDNEDILSKCNTHQEFIYTLVSVYAQKLYPDKNADIWIDHTPSNVSQCDILLKVFPEAKIIHIIRDGRAVASSHKKVKWGKHFIPDMAQHWTERVSLGLASEIQYPKSIMHIYYEDIVGNTEETLKQICSFVDIEYTQDMIKGDGFKLPSYTKHQHKLVGTPPDYSRIESWKNELSQREIEIFEHGAGNLLRILGYEPVYSNPKRIKRIEKLKYRIKKTLNRLRERL